MRHNFYIGAEVKYKTGRNPNPVEVIYKITDFNVFVEDGKVKVYADMKPIKDYPIPDDGGYISKNNTTETNILELERVEQ